MRESIRIFAENMEKVLQENDQKKGVDGWKFEEFSFLTDKLLLESSGLVTALIDGHDEDIIEQTIMVGNYAMMIFDKIRLRKAERDKNSKQKEIKIVKEK